MLINAIGADAGAGAAPPRGAAEADSAVFMQLLLAQLRNQNPLDPVQDKDFMGQVTQLNSLQELQKLNRNLEQLAQTSQLTNAAALVGRHITAQLPDGTQVSGQVRGMTLAGQDVMLVLDGQSVPLGQLVSVGLEEDAHV